VGTCSRVASSYGLFCGVDDEKIVLVAHLLTKNVNQSPHVAGKLGGVEVRRGGRPKGAAQPLPLLAALTRQAVRRPRVGPGQLAFEVLLGAETVVEAAGLFDQLDQPPRIAREHLLGQVSDLVYESTTLIVVGPNQCAKVPALCSPTAICVSQFRGHRDLLRWLESARHVPRQALVRAAARSHLARNIPRTGRGFPAGRDDLADGLVCKPSSAVCNDLVGRVHLFEWEDFSWFPAVLRDAATAYLRRAVEVSGQAAALAPKLQQVLAATGAAQIVDLCSGGAGPTVALARVLGRDAAAVPVLLTDLYPNRPALEEAVRISAGAVTYEPEPVDATCVPERLTGMRTLFNAFHHFRPAAATAILRDAVQARQPVAVFELVSRDPPALFGMVLAPLAVLLLMPTIRPVRVSWLILTYLLPLVPLLVLWDGLVSCLRVYSPDELRELVAALPDNDYEWEVGRLAIGGPARATYLIGRPPP
jgi:hypothetical protein